MKRTYAERYCEAHQLPPEAFENHLLRRSLHAPLRWFWPLANWIKYESFELDRSCVTNIGRLRTRDQVYSEMAEYSYNPINARFWRKTLQQRLSTRRALKALKGLPK